MIEEEWRENFRMSKTSLLRLAEELRPYIEGEETIVRSPVDIVKQVALTLHQSINLCPDDFRLPLVNQVKVCEISLPASWQWMISPHSRKFLHLVQILRG